MTPPEGKVVAVTGASGYIGSRLLQRLEIEPGLRKTVAFDTRPLAAPIHNIAAYRRNLSEPIHQDLSDQNVNTLVHLAFNSRRGTNRREVTAIREENLGILRNVLESCLRSHVEHLVYLSSHTVYGAHQDNPVPITEDTPLRPAVDFPYGYDKYQSELLLEEFGQAQPDFKITILRPSVVLGPAASSTVTNAFFKPWLLGVLDYNPPLQFVYDEDLARVLAIVIMRGLPGVFNVAGSGVVYYRELAKAIDSKLIRLPPFLAYPATQLAWDLGLQKHATAGGLDLIRWPILLSTAKLHQATSYRFWHTSMEAVTAFANANYLYKDPVAI